MILYALYRIGYFLANALPIRVSYAVASGLADMMYLVSAKDRDAFMENLKVVLGPSADERRLKAITREVFRNFANYLVEFFRFAKVDDDYIKKNVMITGLENIDRALAMGKGVIILSAHIGNWELGGFILSLLRQPMAAVALRHQDKRINDFFTRQRLRGALIPIEIGITLRECYRVLRANGLLALLGDRDFSTNGLKAEFFGRPTMVPKGPAVLSHRLGSAIVPSFMTRESDDNFRLAFGEPIFPPKGPDKEEAIREIAARYLPVIEDYIKRYPEQWYVFRKVWNDDGRDLRPDTII
jgi:KDO2-lipid IV(A) lauroyltransferase